MTKLMRSLLLTLGAALLALGSAVSLAESKGVIKIHEGDWTGNFIDTKLVEIILVEEMGYEVESVFLPSGPATWQAILTGDVDVAFEFWPSASPEGHQYLKEFGGDGSVAYLGEVGIVGENGWWVPRYVIEGDPDRGIEAVAPDLKNWEQLNKYAQLFATPETAPKGRLMGCPVPAWQCGNKFRISALNLDYELAVMGTEIAQVAELESYYARGQPVLLYWWAPHWVHAKYDLVRLRLPEYTDECWGGADGWGPHSDCDWPDDIPYNLGSVTLKDRHPDAHQLIWNFKLSNKQQTEMAYEVDVNGREVDEVVREWMAKNEDIWRAWIP
jgi:glycine betaine/proline transport system substrate-binding protein